MVTNMPRHPSSSISVVSSGGAIALAICEPVLTIEIGSARSCCANHLWLTFRLAVKKGASATPRATRAAYMKPYELAVAESIDTSDHSAAAQAYMRLGPKRSTR